MLRNYRKPNERAQKEQSYKFPRGTTAWTKEDIYNMIVKEGTYAALLTQTFCILTGTKRLPPMRWTRMPRRRP